MFIAPQVDSVSMHQDYASRYAFCLSMSLLGLLVVDDASEFFGIEGSSTDQASVDLGHGHEFVNTVGGDGSTVLDTGGLGDFFVVHFGQDGTQKGVCLVWNSI